MRASIFAFFIGLGMSGAALMSIGLPATAALQVIGLLAVFTVALAGMAGFLTGEFGRGRGDFEA